MPNQRAEDKQSVTVALKRDLVAALDTIAKNEVRSRSQVMELILRQQVELYLAGKRNIPTPAANSVISDLANSEIAKEKARRAVQKKSQHDAG